MKEERVENLSADLLDALNKAGDEDRAGSLQRAAEPALTHGLQRVLRALPYALEQQAPPPALKQKILALARAAAPAQTDAGKPPLQLWKSWVNAAPQDLVIQRQKEGKWEATGVEGVAVKRLYVDAERGYVTMLVRMAAGSSYPSHRHAGYEECYVLEGDLKVGENTLHAGDYQRAQGGSVHSVQSTKNGCLLFIVSSQHDELLA